MITIDENEIFEVRMLIPDLDRPVFIPMTLKQMAFHYERLYAPDIGLILINKCRKHNGLEELPKELLAGEK